MFSEATGTIKVKFFVQWIDTVVLKLTCENPLVYQSNGRMEWGLYHMIKNDKFIEITSTLSNAMATWGRECASRGINVGRLYYIMGEGHVKIKIPLRINCYNITQLLLLLSRVHYGLLLLCLIFI